MADLGRKIQMVGVGIVVALVALFVLMSLVEDVKVYAQYTFHICEDNETTDILEFDRENRLIYKTCYYCGAKTSSYKPDEVTPISISEPNCEGDYVVIELWEYGAGGYVIQQTLRFYENTGTGVNHVNTIETKPAVPPTCNTDGYTAEISCADCNKVIQHSTIIPKAHDTYLDGAISATCQNEGYSGDTRCNNCDYFVAGRVLPITDHDTYLDGAVESTCTSVGYSGDTRCHNCDYFVEGVEITQKNHDLHQTSPGRNPTCMQPGYTEIYGCRNCSYEEGGTRIPEVDHSYFTNAWGKYECAWCHRTKDK